MGFISKIIFGLMLVAFSLPSNAILNIEITKGAEGALPIAIIPFAWEGPGSPPQDVAGIVSADLARSGAFAPIAFNNLVARPQSGATVRFQNWKTAGIENLVIGRVKLTGPGSYVVQFQLFDVFREQQLLGFSFPVKNDSLRVVAHEISDIIYEKLVSIRGAFNTQVIYITTRKKAGGDKQYILELSDADGYAPAEILSSVRPLMSPAWSPDALQVAYVSFEDKTVASIYVQVIGTGVRRKISSVKGINGSPVWSPDGKWLAMTLSHKGNPDVYVMELASGRTRQVTRSRAIETEPSWTPDGKSIVFTSDRSGSPQIYEIPMAGGRAKRLTFEGSYNASPSVSPDGKLLTLVHGAKSRYRIAVLERETGVLRVLTNGHLDESPSFAPNGSMIIYATQHRGRGVLGAVSTDGRVQQRFSLSGGDVREPAWSPFIQ